MSTSSSGTVAFSKYPCPPPPPTGCAEHVLGSRAPATNRVDTAPGLVGTGVRGGGAFGHAQDTCVCDRPRGLGAEQRNGLASDEGAVSCYSRPRVWIRRSLGLRLLLGACGDILRMGMASRFLCGASPPLQASHRQLGLNAGIANLSVPKTVSPPAMSRGLQPPPGLLRQGSVSLCTTPGVQTQLMTFRPVSSLSLPSELQASRTYCLLDPLQGPTTRLDSPRPQCGWACDLLAPPIATYCPASGHFRLPVPSPHHLHP